MSKFIRRLILTALCFQISGNLLAQPFIQTKPQVYQNVNNTAKFLITEAGFFFIDFGKKIKFQLFDERSLYERSPEQTSFFLGVDPSGFSYISVGENKWNINGNLTVFVEAKDKEYELNIDNSGTPYASLIDPENGILGVNHNLELPVNDDSELAIALLRGNYDLTNKLKTLVEPYTLKQNGRIYLGDTEIPSGSNLGISRMNKNSNCSNSHLLTNSEFRNYKKNKTEKFLKKYSSDSRKRRIIENGLVINAGDADVVVDFTSGNLNIMKLVGTSENGKNICTIEKLDL